MRVVQPLVKVRPQSRGGASKQSSRDSDAQGLAEPDQGLLEDILAGVPAHAPQRVKDPVEPAPGTTIL